MRSRDGVGGRVVWPFYRRGDVKLPDFALYLGAAPSLSNAKMHPLRLQHKVCAFGCVRAHHHLSSLCPAHPPARSPRGVRVPDRPPRRRRSEQVAKSATFDVTRGDAEEREARRRASRAPHRSHCIHALDVTCGARGRAAVFVLFHISLILIH